MLESLDEITLMLDGYN